MKTENTYSAVETTGSKQAWTEPTLTTLAVSLETQAMTTNGGDAGAAGMSLT